MYVREISAAEATKFAKEREGKEDTEDADWGIFASCVCHRNGGRFFPDGEVPNRQDIQAGLFQKLVLAAVKLNHLEDGDAGKN